MRKSLAASAFLLSVALGGCAGVEVTNFTGAAPSRGYIVYRPVQYVVVANTFDKEGNVSGQSITPIVLMNPNAGSAIRMRPGFGSGSMELSVADGWRLSGLNATSDSQIDEFITAAAGAITGARPEAEIEPGIYRVTYDAQGNANGFVRVPFPTADDE